VVRRIFVKKANRTNLSAIAYLFSGMLLLGHAVFAEAQSNDGAALGTPVANASTANEHAASQPVSPQYEQVQHRLARGWNTWDVHSVTTHVLLPEGLAIHIGLEHNSTEGGDAFLPDALIGRLTPGAEQVFPGEHSWDGSSTDLRVSWKGHSWRIQSARDGDDLVLLATPLPSKPISALPPTIVFSVNFLWNRPGSTLKHPDYIETRGASGIVPIYCTCTRSTRVAGANHDTDQDMGNLNLPVAGPYFSTDFTQPVGISSGKSRTIAEIESVIDRQHRLYQQSVSAAGRNHPRLGYHLRTAKAPGRFSGESGLERSMGRLRHLRLGYVLRCYHGVHRKSRFGLRRCD
jgi:putative isomerase